MNGQGQRKIKGTGPGAWGLKLKVIFDHCIGTYGRRGGDQPPKVTGTVGPYGGKEVIAQEGIHCTRLSVFEMLIRMAIDHAVNIVHILKNYTSR